ncbi:MAG: hypothetical protein ABR587_01140 [Candidatus Binatia bacterium]
MINHDATAAATVHGDVSLAETLPSVALLLGGVPVLTVLMMTAFRYVASGTI